VAIENIERQACRARAPRSKIKWTLPLRMEWRGSRGSPRFPNESMKLGCQGSCLVEGGHSKPTSLILAAMVGAGSRKKFPPPPTLPVLRARARGLVGGYGVLQGPEEQGRAAEVLQEPIPTPTERECAGRK